MSVASKLDSQGEFLGSRGHLAAAIWVRCTMTSISYFFGATSMVRMALEVISPPLMAIRSRVDEGGGRFVELGPDRSRKAVVRPGGEVH